MRNVVWQAAPPSMLSVPSSRQDSQEKGHAVLLLLSTCLLAGNSWGSPDYISKPPCPCSGSCPRLREEPRVIKRKEP